MGFHNDFWLDYESHVEDLRTSLLVYPANGRLPKLVDGVTKIGGLAAAFKDIPGTRPVRFGFGGIGKDGPEDRGLSERCIVSDIGPPLTPGFDNNYLQILQGRDHVVILNEQIHDARTVFLDGRPRPDDELRGWTGYSRGHWEGDTLVIETRNFNGLTQSFDSSGTSYDKVVTERLTRICGRHARIRSDRRRPEDLHGPFHAGVPDGEDRQAPLRVRLPRRQLQHGNHSRRRAQGRSRRAAGQAVRSAAMQLRFMLVLLAPLALAACATQPRIARTSDGKPDLNGIWEAMGSAHWNIEPHNAQAGPIAQMGALGAIPGGLGVVEGGRIPYTRGRRREARGEQGELAGARSAREVLHARRAARDLSAASVPDHAGTRQRC